MAKFLTGSIDVSKIDKSKIQKTDKDGNPFKNGAKYVNIAVWVNDEEDNYGNIASIQQSMGKDAPKNYIGNLKEFKKDGEAKTAESVATSPQGEGDLPF
jgi:hypothetical protein